MRFIFLILISLFTLTSYSQENDDVYWTMYDADTIEQEPQTNITNNYYCDYTSRINRFHRRSFYVSYWSYPFYMSYGWYNPYWSYPFYMSYGWYNPYRYSNWHFRNRYSYWYAYYPTHYGPHYRKANNVKKTIAKTTHKAYNVKPHVPKQKPKPQIRPNNVYQKPATVKYGYKQPVRSPRPTKTINRYTKPRTSPSVVRKSVRSQPQRIQRPRVTNIRKPR